MSFCRGIFRPELLEKEAGGTHSPLMSAEKVLNLPFPHLPGNIGISGLSCSAMVIAKRFLTLMLPFSVLLRSDQGMSSMYGRTSSLFLLTGGSFKRGGLSFLSFSDNISSKVRGVDLQLSIWWKEHHLLRRIILDQSKNFLIELLSLRPYLSPSC